MLRPQKRAFRLLSEMEKHLSRHLELESNGLRVTASGWKWVWRLGGIAASILMVYCIALMVQVAVLGGPPSSAREAFQLLRENRIVGLLRLDLPTMFAMPMYYVLFFALYAALKSTNGPMTSLGTLLGFAGLTLFLAAPSALSMASLADKHAAAGSEEARAQFLAAGEALMASDTWHGTNAMIGGVLMQAGAVLICIVMLRGGVFGSVTAWIGIVMYCLDLTHIIAMTWLPEAGTVLMAIAGPLYPLWFFLVCRRLIRLSVETAAPTMSVSG